MRILFACGISTGGKRKYIAYLVMSALPEYSVFQLALRNGSDREEIWIAYKGIIYEVTQSTLWRFGKHYEHFAGHDLTEELPDAPHTEQVFERLKKIGVLKKEN